MGNLKPFRIEDIENATENQAYFFIAHLFDRLLVGKQNSSQYKELREALNNDQVLEVHFFNGNKEIFASRIGNRLMAYEPLIHSTDPGNEQVVERAYRLEKEITIDGVLYDTLVVKDYIEYDEHHHAYVEKTVLYGLEARGSE